MTETRVEQYEVVLEANKCRAYGLCVGLAPDTFDLPSGQPTVTVSRPVIDADDYEDVAEAVDACPAQALRLLRRAEGS